LGKLRFVFRPLDLQLPLCGFRTIPNIDSGRSRTPIPAEGEHRFRGSRTVIPGIPITDSGHPEH
jgi:hypothetical protein